MAGKIMISDEGLQEASAALSEIAAEISELTQLCDEKGLALQALWIGVGSEPFCDNHATINTLMGKVEAQITSEASAALDAKTRLVATDAGEARKISGLTGLWISLFGE